MNATVHHRFQQATTASIVMATIVALHLLGRGALAGPPVGSMADIESWVRHRDALTIGFAVIRLLALTVAYHLAITTCLMAIGRVLRAPGLVRLADVATLPPLRGTVRRLVGMGVSAGLVLTQPLPVAQASPRAPTTPVASGVDHDPSGRVVVERVATDSFSRAVLEVVEGSPPSLGDRADLERIGEDPSHHRPAVLERVDLPTAPRGRAALERIETSGPHPTGRAALERVEVVPATTPPHDHPDDAHPGSTSSPKVSGNRHLVQPGDHLWSIAADHLGRARGRTPTDSEVGPHWRALVEANPQLVDPDLLFPGDVIHLPPLPT